MSEVKFSEVAQKSVQFIANLGWSVEIHSEGTLFATKTLCPPMHAKSLEELRDFVIVKEFQMGNLVSKDSVTSPKLPDTCVVISADMMRVYENGKETSTTALFPRSFEWPHVFASAQLELIKALQSSGKSE